MYRIRDHIQFTNSSPTWGDGDWEEVNSSLKRPIIMKLRGLEIGPNLRHNMCQGRVRRECGTNKIYPSVY